MSQQQSIFTSIFKIYTDVLVYRFKKLEMANLIASLSIMLALTMPYEDILIRTFFALILNLLVYLHNDICDVEQDLASPKKQSESVQFLLDHLYAANIGQYVLVAILFGIALSYSYDLILVLIICIPTYWLYSEKWKHMPIYDVIGMVMAGAFMPLVAFPLHSGIGWSLTLLLACFAGSFEAIQVMRDYEEDKLAKIKTTAVILGIKKTRMTFAAIMIFASVYTILMLNVFAGPLLLLCLILPFSLKKLESYWNQVRVICGLSWLIILMHLAYTGTTSGWLYQITL